PEQQPWELPNTPGLLDERQAGEYASGQGLGDVRLRSARDGRHIFTHIVWTMRCYTLECSAMPPRYHWATPDELREEISLPTAFRQFVDAE
ncbi:MAG TPA: A/G-specific adenine glycosylase, partial [Clostridiales bacterium]|nr:A/G-specific adenine glycosylase [Clostridiales bacterium]